MSVFFIRFASILSLFLLGAMVSGIMDRHYLIVPFWFIAISTWTLLLGFRRALFIVIPFLVVADVLWDGTVGPVFFSGFLLATATTYVAVRIEERSSLLQICVASILVSFFGTLAIVTPTFWYQHAFTFTDLKTLSTVFFWLLIVTAIFVVPIRRMIIRIESWLDSAHYEQTRKIR